MLEGRGKKKKKKAFLEPCKVVDFWEERFNNSWFHIPITFKIRLTTYLAKSLCRTPEILSQVDQLEWLSFLHSAN